MMPRFASEADRLRAHREAFLLALELGCTPREAEAELRRRAARDRDAQASARLAAKMAAPLPALRRPPADEPWMMRD